MLTFTPDNLTEALLRDPLIADSNVILLLPYLMQLPRVIGARGSNPVSMTEFVEIQRDLIAFMLQQGADRQSEFANLRSHFALAELICSCASLLEGILADKGEPTGLAKPSERGFMLANVIPEALRDSYCNGTLTFEVLARAQPGRFVWIR